MFHHNHPIDSAHVFGFRPVSEETRRKYVCLFSLGHSASSAHHHFEEYIVHERRQSSIALIILQIRVFTGCIISIENGEWKFWDPKMVRIFLKDMSKKLKSSMNVLMELVDVLKCNGIHLKT